MSTPVLFRCDAGAEHGLGHLLRCLVLADALRDAGARPVFRVDAPETILARVAERGYAVTAAGIPTAAPGDLDETLAQAGALADGGRAVLVLDSKRVDADYAAACGQRALVACIDDELRRDLPCTVLVNNNIWAQPQDYPARPGRRALLGPAYNLVQPAYFACADTVRRGVLITMGGEDPANHTAWVLDILSDLWRGLPAVAVIGPAHPAPAAARAAAERANCEVVISPPGLAPLAARCHVGISAGGTTCYELMAAGIATAAIAVEEHQESLIAPLAAAGALVRLDQSAPDAARTAIGRLIKDEEFREKLVQRGRQIVQQSGAGQITRAILEAY